MALSGKDDKEGRLARQRAIGHELRRVFDTVEEEPVPAALRNLAEALEQRLEADSKVAETRGADGASFAARAGSKLR